MRTAAATAFRGAPPRSSAPRPNAFSARPGRVSSWLTAFAARPTRSARRRRARLRERVQRDADELERPRRRAGRQMRAEPALRAAPEVVGEPDRRHRRNGRHRQPDGRADERQAEPAVVDGLRPAREHEIGELAAAVREPAQVAPGRAMLEVELDLLHLEAGADGVDRHPRLDPEAHRDGEHGRAGAAGQVALPGERLTWREPAAQPDQRARGRSSPARGRRRPAPRTRRS